MLFLGLGTKELQKTTRSTQDARDALPGLVPFVQICKREKHSWRRASFSKVADLGILTHSFSTYLIKSCHCANISAQSLQCF